MAVVDRGRVPALLGDQAFGFGERVGQAGAEPGVLLLKGGDRLGLAAEGALPLRCRRRHESQVTGR